MLNAVCEARTTKSSKTAMASRIMTCFLLVRFGARVGVGALTLSQGQSKARESPYAAIIEAEKRFGTLYQVPLVGRFASRCKLFEHRLVGRLGFVRAIEGQSSAARAVRVGANP